MEGREFQLPPSREKEKLPLPAGEFHSFGVFFPGKFRELLLLSLLRDFFCGFLARRGAGASGMTGKGDREYSQPGIAAPAPSGGSDIPAAVPMDSFSLRRAGGGREGPGVRISVDAPGIRGVSFGISGWDGHSWDAGVEFRDPGRIPGVRNAFPAAFPVFSLPLFPVFFPRAAVVWVVLEPLPRNPWDSLIHPKIPGM